MPKRGRKSGNMMVFGLAALGLGAWWLMRRGEAARTGAPRRTGGGGPWEGGVPPEGLAFTEPWDLVDWPAEFGTAEGGPPPYKPATGVYEGVYVDPAWAWSWEPGKSSPPTFPLEGPVFPPLTSTEERLRDRFLARFRPSHFGAGERVPMKGTYMDVDLIPPPVSMTPEERARQHAFLARFRPGHFGPRAAPAPYGAPPPARVNGYAFTPMPGTYMDLDIIPPPARMTPEERARQHAFLARFRPQHFGSTAGAYRGRTLGEPELYHGGFAPYMTAEDRARRDAFLAQFRPEHFGRPRHVPSPVTAPVTVRPAAGGGGGGDVHVVMH